MNYGPLTYHFASSTCLDAAEVPYGMLMKYIVSKGFRFVLNYNHFVIKMWIVRIFRMVGWSQKIEIVMSEHYFTVTYT